MKGPQFPTDSEHDMFFFETVGLLKEFFGHHIIIISIHFCSCSGRSPQNVRNRSQKDHQNLRNPPGRCLVSSLSERRQQRETSCGSSKAPRCHGGRWWFDAALGNEEKETEKLFGKGELFPRYGGWVTPRKSNIAPEK